MKGWSQEARVAWPLRHGNPVGGNLLGGRAGASHAGRYVCLLSGSGRRGLYLVRDRLEEKPLYYSLHGHTLLFTSELKALWAYPKFQGEIDRDALTLFLYRNMIPAPHSIYKEFSNFLRGHG